MIHARPSRVGLAISGLLLLVFAFLAAPHINRGEVRGGDAVEYVHLSESLLRGSYLVSYDGPPRLTRFTPGFSILLMPAAALGGPESAVWVGYLAALVLGALAALLAWRIGGGVASPLAVFFSLFTVNVYTMAHEIMSDLPSATIALAEITLLALGGGSISAVAAGLLAGSLVWIRPGCLLLAMAGVAGLSAGPAGKRRLIGYAAGVVLPVALLAAWQWSAFGSPFITSYQAVGVGVRGNGSDLSSFFSPEYVFGPPWNTYQVGTAPNGVVYPLALMGFDNNATYAGVGLVGLIGVCMLARRRGPAGALGRFALAANAITLLLYGPYFYRDLRFLIIPEILNDLSAALLVAWAVSAVRGAIPPGRRSDRAAPARRAHGRAR